MFRYRLSNLRCDLDSSLEALKSRVAEKLRLAPDALLDFQIVKESIDARKKPRVYYVRQVEFTLKKAYSGPKIPQFDAIERSRLDIPDPNFLGHNYPENKGPVVVVGAGPAGMFAALALAEAGVPTVLIERGKAVETRMRDIGALRALGRLDTESNICFGEGGAGAYTDGKLYTRVKHPYVRWVMRRLVDFEAKSEILVEAHPHLGTDKLVRIVKRMRQHLIDLGVDIRFQTRVESLLLSDRKVEGVRLSDGSEIASESVILAIGHSARDTLEKLLSQRVTIEAKGFAVGVRVEHPQAMIDQNQYGSVDLKSTLGAAAYQLTYQHPDGKLGKRGVYSFCMCPGGFVVPSPTEAGRMAVNGMSNAGRSTPYANSGMVVQVTPEDLIHQGYDDNPLIGLAFQRDLERKTFLSTKQEYAAPAMRIKDFMARKSTGKLAPSNFRPAIEAYDLWTLLPPWIANPLAGAFASFERKIPGFIGEDGNMIAIESRTSSPLRLTRNGQMESVNTPGLYPVGEGAGYAGGIVSAAVDGVRAAEAIVEKWGRGPSGH